MELDEKALEAAANELLESWTPNTRRYLARAVIAAYEKHRPIPGGEEVEGMVKRLRDLYGTQVVPDQRGVFGPTVTGAALRDAADTLEALFTRINHLQSHSSMIRDEAIEEAAKAVEGDPLWETAARYHAKAIRALKTKPREDSGQSPATNAGDSGRSRTVDGATKNV